MEIVKDKPGGQEDFEDEQTSRRSMLDGKHADRLSIFLDNPEPNWVQWGVMLELKNTKQHTITNKGQRLLSSSADVTMNEVFIRYSVIEGKIWNRAE